MDINIRSKIASDIFNQVVKSYPKNDIYAIGKEFVNLSTPKDTKYKENYYLFFLQGMHHVLASCYNACLKDDEEAIETLNDIIKDMIVIREYSNITLGTSFNLNDVSGLNPFKLFINHTVKINLTNCDSNFENMVRYSLANGIIVGTTIFNQHNSTGNGTKEYWLDIINTLATDMNNHNVSFTPLTIKKILGEKDNG